MKKVWKEKDEGYLRTHHDTMTADQMARHLNKTYDQVKAKLRRMKLKSLDDSMTKSNRKWSEFIENNKLKNTWHITVLNVKNYSLNRRNYGYVIYVELIGTLRMNF